jgi:hypothetical protein
VRFLQRNVSRTEEKERANQSKFRLTHIPIESRIRYIFSVANVQTRRILSKSEWNRNRLVFRQCSAYRRRVLFPASQNRVVRVLEQRIGKRIAAANDGAIKFDILQHFRSKGTMNSNKYIWLLLGGFAAMAFFVACQQQGSTATTPAASSTRGVTERQVRSRGQTTSASTNRDIAPGGMRRAPTASPTP